MRKVIIFNGYNEDNFFIQVNNFIYKLEHRERFFGDDFSGINIEEFYMSPNEDLYKTIKDILKEEQYIQKNKFNLSCENINNEMMNDGIEYTYVLKVENQNSQRDFDVIPLRIFSILMRRYPVYLGIKDNIYKQNDSNKKEDSNYFRISTYMLLDYWCSMNNWYASWDNKKNGKKKLNLDTNKIPRASLYNRVFYISANNNTLNIKRLAINNFQKLNRLIPCIYMDWEWYQFLSDSVGTHINNFIIDENIEEEEKIQKDIIYKLQKEITSNVNWLDCSFYDNKIDENEWGRILRKTILKEICVDNLKDAHVIYNDNEDEVFSYCKNMSILALLLFSSFCHFIYASNKEKLSDIELNNLFQAAQDFSEGLLQLIENAIDYAEMSCFSFRIHSSENNILKEKYNEVIIKDNKYYLEVIITDINYGKNIVDTFIDNLKFRVKEEALPEKLVEEIINNIDLKGFFEPDDKMKSLWNKYYMIAENATSHYGLQLFNTLTSYYKGYFNVCSISFNDKKNIHNLCFAKDYSKKTEGERKANGFVLPGTQYSILLPLRNHDEQKRVGIHLEPAYDDISLKYNWENNMVSIETLFNDRQRKTFNDSKVYKKYHINNIANKIQNEFKKNKINVVDISMLNSLIDVEIFSKAMISYILREQGSNLRVALINAEHHVMLEFTRFFAIFYDKSGKCPSMKKTQLFMCDKDLRTEITFVGDDLSATLAGNELWANAKGEYNKCLEMLQIILKQRNVNQGNKKNNVKVAPFELMVNDNGVTLFERRVYNDLLSNIQEESFGCLLKDIHMRVGSKMHVTDHFYETFQLFNSSLYNSRFAYLVAKKITTELREEDCKNLVLVGYDVYSELLILETQKILEKIFGIKVGVIIYEQSPRPNFRMWEDNMKNSKFVIIVPTSTTLTTHGKIIVELEKVSECKKISSSVLLNIALILIRDSSQKNKDGILNEGTPKEEKRPKNLTSIEKNYWQIIKDEPEERAVWTETTNPPKVSYNVLVESKWQEPLSCDCCYPSISLLDEKPIIEVNRGSVVPMIMAGPQESSLKNENNERVPEGNIELLKDVFLYGHCKRKNNHFKYYIKTDELMKKILDNNVDEKNFSNWISFVETKIKKQHNEQIQTIKEKQIPYVYDILVAPIHETNATFLEKINGRIFNNVPIVLYMDSDREYRENILSKYSHLTALYNNIMKTGRRAIINFHYIDDCINSGVAFRRTHSLLQTLFPAEAYDSDAQVQVNLFQNIILLLNRNSKGTIKGYTHKGSFFSYINLNISSLRNHHDNACAVCSEVSDDKRIKDKTAINSMATSWKNIIVRKGVKTIEKTEENNKDTKLKDRHFRRLICTHEINSFLDDMGWDRNKKECVHKKISQIIKERVTDDKLNNEEKLEYIMAYFTVLSKPYLSYRKSILDVIFPILLQTLNAIINFNTSFEDKNINDDIQGGNDLIEIIYNRFNDCSSLELKRDFLKVMITSLSRLGASYLIRVDVLNKIFDLTKNLNFKQDEFELFYASAIKRLITLGKDESIGLWLEYLILNKFEYGDSKKTQLNISEDFKDFLFYENTTIIADAIDEFVYKDVININDINNYIDKYYFDNFRKLISIDYQGSFSNDFWKINHINFMQNLHGMIKLRQHLKNSNDNIEDYYKTLIDYVKETTDAEYVCIYGKDVSEQIYVISSTDESKYTYTSFIEIEKLRENTLEKSQYLNESVCIHKDRVFLCLTEKNKDEEQFISNNDKVWLMLEFEDRGIEMFCDRVKFSIRNVLVNRNLLWERLQSDFKKDAFTRIKELSIKNELLSKSKAGSHTPDEELRKLETQLRNFDASCKTSFLWAGALLQLASDSLISKLYVEKIRDEDKKFISEKCKLNCEEFCFDATIESLLNQMNFINKDDSMLSPTNAKINVSDDAKTFSFLCPDEKRFYDIYIVAALVQNAVNYGKAEDNIVKVDIRIENGYLVFENQLKDGYKNGSKSNSVYKSSLEEGITLSALQFYFKKYYGKEICFGNSDFEGRYIVKIPVVNVKI